MTILTEQQSAQAGGLSWLLAGGRSSARADREVPHNLHFEFLKGIRSTKTAAQFARAFAERNHATNLSWYAAYPYAGGLVVEIHEGGSGHALWPALIEALEQRRGAGAEDPVVTGTVRTSSLRQVLIEVTPWGVSTLVLPEGTEIPELDLDIRKMGTRLQMLVPPYAQYALMTGWAFTGLALLTLLFTVAFRSASPHVEYVRPWAPQAPLANEFASRMAGDGMYFKDGTWHAVDGAPVPRSSTSIDKGGRHGQ